MDSYYDVIVGGAGPAGSTAARICAKSGLKTLLLEQATLGRKKLCGGAITDQALRQLDFRIDSSLVERECYGARIHYKGLSAEVKKRERIAILTSREKFDYLLAEKAVEAGCKLVERERLVSLLIEADRAIVETDGSKFEAKMVIGADGVNSRVARCIRPDYGRDEIGLALQAEIVMSDEEVDEYIKDMIEIFFGITGAAGYGWVFPKQGRLDVGTGGLYSEFKDPLETFKRFLASLGFDQNVEIRGHFVPWGGFERKVSGSRILLAGDAAGFVDAFIFEGVRYAIESGKLAAQCAVKAFEADDFSERALAEYEASCHNSFGKNLQHSLAFSKLAYSNPDLILASIVRNQGLFEKYLEVPLGRLSYLGYLLWLLPRLPYHAIRNAFKPQL